MSSTITVELSITPELVAAVAKEAAKAINEDLGEPLTPDELFEKMGGRVSRSTIYRRIDAGKIRTVPDVGRTLIPAAEVERLLS